MNCSICLESIPLSDGSLRSTSSLCPSSNTAICETCMVDYLESEISQAKINPNGTIDCFCLSKSACSNQFSPLLILSILPSTTIQKYQQFHTNAIVSADPTKIWCPSRTCSANGNGIANIDKRNSHKAKCESCNFTFCSLCKQQHLSYVIPLCKFYQGQNQNQNENQSQSDRKPSASSSTSPSPSPSPNVDEGLHQWKSEHGGKCKKCPKCRNYIEKNGGCDHMTCKICKHEFCWRCKSTYDKGCTAGKFCFLLAANKHHRWGQSTTTRAASKSVAYPLLAVAAGGVVGAGIGVGIAVGAGVVAVGAIAAPVYGSIKLYKLAKESSQEPVQPDPPQQPIQEIRTRPAQLQRSRPFRLPPSHRLDELHVSQNHNDLTPRSSNSSMSEMDLRMAITTRTIQPHVEVYDMLSSSVDFVDDLLDDISRPNSLPFPV